MSETADGEERSEEPTDKRLADAREKGQVPRSRELASVAALLASAAMLLATGDDMVRSFVELLRVSFDIPRADIFDTTAMVRRLSVAIVDGLLIAVPLMVLLAVVGVLGNIALSGWNFAPQAFAPKFEKLNPISGMARIFSWRGIVELAKALAKFTLVAVVAVVWLQSKGGQLLGLGGEPPDQAIAHAGELLVWAFLMTSASLILVAAVDVPFQLWDNQRQLKMTKQEVKEEHKQTQGSPEVKGRQRAMQRQMAMRRMMQEVPKADVVVTNPTHYAVALRYDQGEMDAPKVVAKGADVIAARIREIALENKVPILSAPALARALYHTTEVDEFIPAGLYRAVAQVLAYVFHLRQGPVYNRGGATSFDDLPIPEDLRYDS